MKFSEVLEQHLLKGQKITRLSWKDEPSEYYRIHDNRLINSGGYSTWVTLSDLLADDWGVLNED